MDYFTNSVYAVHYLNSAMCIIALAGAFAWGTFYKHIFEKKAVVVNGFKALAFTCFLGVLSPVFEWFYFSGLWSFSSESIALLALLGALAGLISSFIFSAYRYQTITATLTCLLYFFVAGANSWEIWIMPVFLVYCGLFLSIIKNKWGQSEDD